MWSNGFNIVMGQCFSLVRHKTCRDTTLAGLVRKKKATQLRDADGKVLILEFKLFSS